MGEKVAILAVFDSDAGALLWLGDTADVTAAVRALRDQSGDWHADDLYDGDDDVLVYQLVDGEAVKLQQWWDAGNRVGSFPEPVDKGTVYTVAEVKAMLA